MAKLLTGVALCFALIVGLAGPAMAGEWAPGNDKLTPVKERGVAASECAFSGRDEPDDGAAGSDADLDDDALWAMGPSKGNVQSPGQLMVIGVTPPGVPGDACRGNLGGE